MTTIDGKRVSPAWAVVLSEARRQGVVFHLNSGQRLMSEQQALYDLYKSGRGNLAAVPSPTAPHVRAGHQHHCLDIEPNGGQTRLAGWLRVRGVPASFNVPSENWHLDPVSEPALLDLAQRVRWRGYTESERRWITEYDHLRKAQVIRRGTLRRVMMLQRKRIWRAAQEPGGWDKSNRRARYASLKARTA